MKTLTMSGIQKWFALLAAAFIASSALAQSDTDAFYIYQNDGHFDGFFYDQVQKISYSRLDTAGVEWDDFVSQEIVTEDSTYRIMLSAIDSVSFVQPEIRFNPKMRMLDNDGTAPYVLRAEGMILVLKGSTPVSLQPKPGDVIACVHVPGQDGPFVGKVVTTYAFDDQLCIACDKVTELKDIFEQFITVEEVVSSDNLQHARRRIAGIGPRRAEGNWNGELFQMNVDLTDSYALSDAWTVNFNLHAGFAMKAQVVYNISWTKFYLKMLLEERAELGFKTTIDGQICAYDNVLEQGAVAKVLLAMSRLHFPAQFPLLYIDVTPKPFVRGEAHFNIGLNLGVSSRIFQQSFLISSEPPYFDFHLISPNRSEWLKPSLSLTAELNGMVQAGVKYPFVLANEDFLDKIFKWNIGNKLYTGPKLTGAISLDVIKAVSGSGVYEAFKDTKLNAYMYSFDNELTFKMKGLFGKTVKRTYARSLPMGAFELGAFPQFDNVKYELKGEQERDLHASMEVNGEVFLPQYLGFALYDRKGKMLQQKIRDERYLINTFNKVEADFKNLANGAYIVRPFTRVLGMDVPIYSEEKKFEINVPLLKLNPSVLKVDEEGGSFSVDVDGGLGGELTYYCEQGWIHLDPQSRLTSINVNVDPNGTFRYREGKVIVYERISDVEELTDTLVVKQYSGISLEKEELEFNDDGGTEIVRVMTLLDGVQCTVRDNTDPHTDWLNVSLGGEALTITATANTSSERSATVVLSAFNKTGDGIVATCLKVTQKSLLVVPSDTISFKADGGVYTMTVTNALPQLTVTKEASWLGASALNNTTFWVQAKKNYRTAREAPIVITATDGSKSVSRTLIVKQEAAPESEWPYIRVSNRSVTIPAAGGEQAVEVQTNMADVGIDIQSEDGYWLGVTYDAEAEKCKFEANRNTTGRKRSATVTLTVVNSEYEDYEEITVTQDPYQDIVTYDGIAVTLRWRGDAYSEIYDEGASHQTWPLDRGVYGTGPSGVGGSSITSKGNDPAVGIWEAHFYTVNGLMYGSFKWQNYYGDEGLEVSINGAPVGQSGPLKHGGAYRGDVHWLGDACRCLPPVGQWGHSVVDGTNSGFVGYFDKWHIELDQYGNKTGVHHDYYSTYPVEVDVFLRRPEQGGDLPYGHPDAP